MTFVDARGNEVEPSPFAVWGWMDPEGTVRELAPTDETGDDRGLFPWITLYEMMFVRVHRPVPESLIDRLFTHACDPRDEIPQWVGEGDG